MNKQLKKTLAKIRKLSTENAKLLRARTPQAKKLRKIVGQALIDSDIIVGDATAEEVGEAVAKTSKTNQQALLANLILKNNNLSLFHKPKTHRKLNKGIVIQKKIRYFDISDEDLDEVKRSHRIPDELKEIRKALRAEAKAMKDLADKIKHRYELAEQTGASVDLFGARDVFLQEKKKLLEKLGELKDSSLGNADIDQLVSSNDGLKQLMNRQIGLIKEKLSKIIGTDQGPLEKAFKLMSDKMTDDNFIQVFQRFLENPNSFSVTEGKRGGSEFHPYLEAINTLDEELKDQIKFFKNKQDILNNTILARGAMTEINLTDLTPYNENKLKLLETALDHFNYGAKNPQQKKTQTNLTQGAKILSTYANVNLATLALISKVLQVQAITEHKRSGWGKQFGGYASFKSSEEAVGSGADGTLVRKGFVIEGKGLTIKLHEYKNVLDSAISKDFATIDSDLYSKVTAVHEHLEVLGNIYETYKDHVEEGELTTLDQSGNRIFNEEQFPETKRIGELYSNRVTELLNTLYDLKNYCMESIQESDKVKMLYFSTHLKQGGK